MRGLFGSFDVKCPMHTNCLLLCEMEAVVMEERWGWFDRSGKMKMRYFFLILLFFYLSFLNNDALALTHVFI